MSTAALDRPRPSAAEVNHWPDSRCAKAFWSQRDVPAYRHLLADTCAWLDPVACESWLDLGCGGGQLSRAVWEKSGGTVGEIIALDCAAVNADAIAKLGSARVRFLHADFSHGLGVCPDGSHDGVVSGLAIQYAESFDAARGVWTSDAYDSLLAEVYRVLRDGGRFVFSVNVPKPNWFRVALGGLPGVMGAPRPLRFLKNSLRMLKYGAWLKREARKDRFHYLPAAVVAAKLGAAGFISIEHKLSFAGQAFIFRCRKSA